MNSTSWVHLIFPIAGKGQERRWINHRARITSTLCAHAIKGKLFFFLIQRENVIEVKPQEQNNCIFYQLHKSHCLEAYKNYLFEFLVGLIDVRIRNHAGPDFCAAIL